MALYTTAKLLTFVKQQARRPATDESMSDATWYDYLSRAQRYWLQVIVTVAPWSNISAPTAITSADGGVTYTFGTDGEGSDNITPLGHVELYDGEKGVLLRPGTYDDVGCDYILEGDRIRFPGNVARTFGSGLYARFTNPIPDDLSASQEPVLKPTNARILIAYRALIMWSEEDGGRDPIKWVNAEQQHWFGNPAVGDHGILGSLKTQVRNSGLAAIDQDQFYWWRGNGWGSRSL